MTTRSNRSSKSRSRMSINDLKESVSTINKQIKDLGNKENTKQEMSTIQVTPIAKTEMETTFNELDIKLIEAKDKVIV